MYRNSYDTIPPAPTRKITAMIALCAVAGLLVWSALPGPANAAERPADEFTRSVTITVHGGDLDKPAAAKRLFDRIEEAALEVCGASRFSFPDVRRAVRRSDCWRQSVSRAVAELHDTRLNAQLAQRLDLDRGPIARQD